MADGAILLRLDLPAIPNTVTFPPLPPITDPILAKQVFTHSSYHALRRRATAISLDGDEKLLDNEKLEHVGDGLIGGIVTLLLDERYPTMKPGPATMLKAQLVRDSLLAQLSRQYGFPDRLICNPDARMTLVKGEKTVANLFEAYVAGLFYSYLHSPTNLTTPPPTPRTRPSSDDDVPQPRVRTHGEAVDHLEEWLKPLFLSLAEWVLQLLHDERDRIDAETGRGKDSGDDEDRLAVGSIARMNEHFIVKEGGKPEFRLISSENGLWKMRCEAITRQGELLTAEATRTTKKAASTIAAWRICQQMGL